MIHRLKVSADEAWANHVGAQVKDYIGEALTPINKRLDQTDLWRLHHDERHDRLETLMTTLGSKTEALHDDLRAHMAEEERNKREPS